MAYIAHRCSCGHLSSAHLLASDKDMANANRSCKVCRDCTKPDLNPEPEIVPTWNRHGERVTTLIEPGQVWEAGGFVHQLATCGCAACKKLYEREDTPA